MVAYCRERLALDPVSLDFGGQAQALGSVLTGLMRPEGNDAADVLQLFVDKLATAVVSCDSPRFLSFIPAAPTKAALLFDMFVSCSSLHGTSWLEAAGVVVAENQALGGHRRRRPAFPPRPGDASCPAARPGTSRPSWWPATRPATGAAASGRPTRWSP